MNHISPTKLNYGSWKLQWNSLNICKINCTCTTCTCINLLIYFIYSDCGQRFWIMAHKKYRYRKWLNIEQIFFIGCIDHCLHQSCFILLNYCKNHIFGNPIFVEIIFGNSLRKIHIKIIKRSCYAFSVIHFETKVWFHSVSSFYWYITTKYELNINKIQNYCETFIFIQSDSFWLIY